jgi:potassium-transporting ATPase KdpC subunit
MKQILIALKFLLIMTVLTGIIYPVAMTGIAQICFPSKANGSLIIRDGKPIGSELIGQKFDSTVYFWPRPSASDYNPVPSAASNYGPTSDTLKKLVTMRRARFAEMNSIPHAMSVPKEMVFASGSGLDPHISPEAASMQAARVIKARHFNSKQEEKLLKTIKDLTEGPQFLFLGESRINLLKLNLAADKIQNDFINNK